MISFIIPSYNNLRHLRNVYASIQKHEPQAEVVLLDDGSTDGTWEWMQEQKQSAKGKVIVHRSENRVGHTILYDVGIDLATNDIVSILHADMIVGPNYVKNATKHLKQGTVVCATRVEPPLHPVAKEKILRDFGQDFDTLRIEAFEEFVLAEQISNKDVTTRGMFAPWFIYKKDFQAIGGHDHLFAPFPNEDSDIFQRWMLAGYEIVQSWDALVYHLTCRGHRWTEVVGQDDTFFKQAAHRASRNYLRKWGSWIANDEYQCPIIKPKYNIAFVVKNCNLEMLEVFEPWCDRIYIDDTMQVITSHYIDKEQPNTKFNLAKRIYTIEHNDPKLENDIIVEFNMKQFDQQSFNIIQQLPEIIKESGEVGGFELDVFKITINSLTEYQNDLIVCKN